MSGRPAVASLRTRPDNALGAREAVDPRLEPFLRELAHLLWCDVKRQLQYPEKKSHP